MTKFYLQINGDSTRNSFSPSGGRKSTNRVVIINIISSVVSVPVSVSVYIIVIVIVTIRIILVDDERSYFMFQYWSV